MFRSILVPVDVEHESCYAPVLPVAARLARDHRAELHLLTVIVPMGSAFVSSFLPKGLEQKLADRTKASLAAIAAGRDLLGVEPRLHLTHGTVYEEILRAAKRLSADVVVLAANRPERGHYLLGPNAARVVRHADASVLVVRPGAEAG